MMVMSALIKSNGDNEDCDKRWQWQWEMFIKSDSDGESFGKKWR